ncbi:MAG: DNA repair exonuclease, partial [Patescibacteria group bacterium]
MKFIHTADVHLGAQLKIFGEKGKAARNAIEKTFSKIADLAMEEKADFLFIAGDLFDSNNPGKRLLDFVRLEFSRLNEAGVKVVVTPGNHDAASSDSVYFKKEFQNDLPDVFVFLDKKNPKKEYPEFNLIVHSFVCSAYESAQNPFAAVSAESGKINVALLHGSSSKTAGEDYKKYYPFEPKDVAKSEMNYVALGHYHSFRDESSGGVPAVYCGSPEPVAVSQKGAGSVVLGEISEKGEAKISRIRVSETEFDEINVILDDIADISELKQKIAEGANENLIRTAALSGFASPRLFIDNRALEEELGGL